MPTIMSLSLLRLESDGVLECLGRCFGGKRTCLKGSRPSISFQHGKTGDFGCGEGCSELGREVSMSGASKMGKWTIKGLR